LSSSL